MWLLTKCYCWEVRILLNDGFLSTSNPMITSNHDSDSTSTDHYRFWSYQENVSMGKIWSRLVLTSTMAKFCIELSYCNQKLEIGTSDTTHKLMCVHSCSIGKLHVGSLPPPNSLQRSLILPCNWCLQKCKKLCKNGSIAGQHAARLLLLVSDGASCKEAPDWRATRFCKLKLFKSAQNWSNAGQHVRSCVGFWSFIFFLLQHQGAGQNSIPITVITITGSKQPPYDPSEHVLQPRHWYTHVINLKSREKQWRLVTVSESWDRQSADRQLPCHH